jgi:Holliday junction resolvase RusA-like endonuclease
VVEQQYTLDVSPQTSPRPRLGKFGAFMPVKYKMYQEMLMYEMQKHSIPKADYTEILVIAYFPYPKSTPKKRLIEGDRMRKKPDADNVLKAICDCLEKLDIVENDSQLHRMTSVKYYTTEKQGRIIFQLSL